MKIGQRAAKGPQFPARRVLSLYFLYVHLGLECKSVSLYFGKWFALLPRYGLEGINESKRPWDFTAELYLCCENLVVLTVPPRNNNAGHRGSSGLFYTTNERKRGNSCGLYGVGVPLKPSKSVGLMLSFPASRSSGPNPRALGLQDHHSSEGSGEKIQPTELERHPKWQPGITPRLPG